MLEFSKCWKWLHWKSRLNVSQQRKKAKILKTVDEVQSILALGFRNPRPMVKLIRMTTSINLSSPNEKRSTTL